ncbi:MAG: hypothetical protein LBN09_07175 [Clostridioides sp.]|jgi:hypothetical protein|nr:hypothetical protein [Clostridioides sp.]
MKIRFNMKGLIIGIVLVAFVLGGFLIIPGMFVEKTKAVDYTMLNREAVPVKLLDMMDKYTNEERALVAKMGDKVYIMVTRGENSKSGIKLEKIETVKQDGKEIVRVKAKFEDKQKADPYIIALTNLEKLPAEVELQIAK